MPVITPTGSSRGLIIVRDNVSQITRKIAPAKHEEGKSISWFTPTILRIKWGTISPTKPMTPEDATHAPVIKEASIKSIFFIRFESTPRCRAFSSPRDMIFNSREKINVKPVLQITTIETILIKAVCVVDRLPINQRIIP